MTVRPARPASGWDADERGWFGGEDGLRRAFHARGAGRGPRRAHRRLAGGDGRPGRSSADFATHPAASTPDCRARSTRRRGSREQVGCRILLKREDLNHTGAHKIRNVLGQALLTKRMGKTRVIAETGAGQHGVASATAAAYFGLDCTVYMGSVDTKRQALNVARMQLLGAKVDPGRLRQRHAQGRHQRGAARLGRAASTTRPTSSARRPARTPSRAWSATSPAASATRRGPSASSGTACCRDAHRRLRRRRVQRDRAVHRVPRRPDVEIYGFEAGGDGVETGRHAATITAGDAGVLHGARPTCSRTRTARPSSRTRSRPASTTPGSARSTPTSRRPGGRRTSR